ncbi:MAG: L,D-transpeptidase family protein [Mucilaginibacter sp.]|uniref:L,D-transpeptidase family protein n=1 Tax=Mucilaginibacter sp. TaxID=1882438 RepID=UPI00326331CC
MFATEISTFYHKRNFALAWYDNGKVIEQAGNLTNRVLNLQNEGIKQIPPYKRILDSLFYNNDPQSSQPDVQLELMLTAQYFLFSKVAWGGMNDSVSTSVNWYVPRKKVSYGDYLDSLLKAPASQTRVKEPVYRQYELLRAYLRKYRELDMAESWPPIIYNARSRKLGDTSATVQIVKSRLYKFGDYSGDTTSHLFEPGLVNALKNFQNRYGLTSNGILDRATCLQLSVPLKKLIQQIIVNMERSRWLPVSITGDYISVNIPEFKMHVYHADSLLWSCDVVVGKSVHQTTVFYGEIKYVVFSPYWNVPPSIVSKEVIPGIKRNSDYLSKQNMEIIGHSDGLPVVRQKPGNINSLGLVKFLFPNSYNIYLHDTPSKYLFGESSRDFSHGCIRIKEPVKLAEFLLKDRPEWNAGTISQAMHSGKEKYITLKNKVPVFIAYFTAFIDRNNKINFRKDIYDRDNKLAATIISGNGNY